MHGGEQQDLDPETDGCLGTNVRQDYPLLCPPSSYIPSFVSRCRSAEHLCQKFTSPWGFSVFPEEKEATCAAMFTMQPTACSRSRRTCNCK